VRKTKDSGQNDGKDFNRSLHPFSRRFTKSSYGYSWSYRYGDTIARCLNYTIVGILAA
jgi:hypothetical protein